MIGPLFAWGDALRAAKARRRTLRRRAAILGVGVSFVLVSAVLPPTPRLVWNVTPSAPVGLYLVAPHADIVTGDMVIARVPRRYRRLAAMRRYVPRDVPLVKRVAAVAGDTVCARDRRISINGGPAARRRTFDGRGRAMPLWSGCRRLRASQLFLLNADPASFDGRYFGVSEGSDLIGKATLLWAR